MTEDAKTRFARLDNEIDDANPERRNVLAFAGQRLAAASNAPRQDTVGEWYPTRADGRDPSGYVHVSVVHTRVVILDVPDHWYRCPREVAQAVLDATNQALERLQHDVLTHFDQTSGGIELPSWEELALKVRRLRAGYW